VAGGEGFTYLGAQVIDPAGLDRISGDAFSLNLVWDRMMAEGRLYGAVYPGDWCDVGRPEGIAAAEAMLRDAGDA
jgi:MurNAc alpha-1-phosphate uridylyltransferase